ncbi:MAG: AmmeMemoRadiSam system protein B, partial [Desulfobacteraceae bacterium]|nr:AmmeMemoRadiSam system protein B [Desulfobacteraceae bacterium]
MGRKKAAFRSAWYPESAEECESHIKGYLKDNNGIKKDDFPGCIVPHAGWFYSGSIACRTIGSLASLLGQERNLDCIVIFGLHMNADDSPIILESGSWETPFGDLDIQKSFGANIVEKALTEKIKLWKKSNRSFPEENTIELQLPFIKYFFP